MNGNISAAIMNIDKAISNYKSFGKNCYQGLLNDMSCLKAQLSFLDGKDTIAYEIYKKLYAANSKQADVKSKLDYLKIKLGMDVIAPSITLINPQVDGTEAAPSL